MAAAAAILRSEIKQRGMEEAGINIFNIWQEREMPLPVAETEKCLEHPIFCGDRPRRDN